MVTGFEDGDPLSAVVAAEDARFAAMVVLERLTPDQRVAFVLHDGFAVPFGRDRVGARSQGRPQRGSSPRGRDGRRTAALAAADGTHNEVVGPLMAALADGDMEAVVACCIRR